jgi:hypothetical protein
MGDSGSMDHCPCSADRSRQREKNIRPDECEHDRRRNQCSDPPSPPASAPPRDLLGVVRIDALALFARVQEQRRELGEFVGWFEQGHDKPLLEG